MTTLSFLIPPEDLAEFAALPGYVHLKITRRLAALAFIDAHGERTRRAAIAERAALLELRPGVLRRLYLAYIQTGDWRVLVPRSARPRVSRLPEDFVRYLNQLLDCHGPGMRTKKSVCREVRRMWMARQPIPGYEGHPGWPAFPEGWSHSTLRRQFRPQVRLTLKTIKASHSVRVH